MHHAIVNKRWMGNNNGEKHAVILCLLDIFFQFFSWLMFLFLRHVRFCHVVSVFFFSVLDFYGGVVVEERKNTGIFDFFSWQVSVNRGGTLVMKRCDRMNACEKVIESWIEMDTT